MVQGGLPYPLFFQFVEVFECGDDGGREQGDDEGDGGEGLAETHTVRQHTATPRVSLFGRFF